MAHPDIVAPNHLSCSDSNDAAIAFLRWKREGQAANVRTDVHHEVAGVAALAVDKAGVRDEVEARLLAGQPFADIARLTGHPEGVIRRYESLFFAVTGKLDTPSWVTRRVFGMRVHEGIDQADIGTIGKLVAVDPFGLPWVVNSAGVIFRFNGTSWVGVPGPAMIDIGVGANGTAPTESSCFPKCSSERDGKTAVERPQPFDAVWNHCSCGPGTRL